MPFDGFDDVHTAIRKAVKHARTLRPDLAGLESVRADDLRSKVVLEKILGQIGEARVVVADLTGRNANVFYETGIAQTVKDNVILLAQNIEDIPADLQPFEYVLYEDSKAGRERLVTDLAEAVRQLPEETVAAVRQDWGTPQGMKRQLRQALEQCEQQWIQDVIPTQAEVVAKALRQRDPATDEEIEASVELLQPAFLDPWRGIEEAGFAAIANGTPDVLPELVGALRQAHDLPTRVNTHPLVAGHGPLLALRTWMLWGAFALDHENWGAVHDLLHYRVLFRSAHDLSANQDYDWDIETFSFSEYTRIYYSEAAKSDARLTTKAIFNNTDEAIEAFGSEHSLRSLCGLWLFASYLAHTARAKEVGDYFKISCVAVEYPPFPTWHASSRDGFRDLATRLENEYSYSRTFTETVSLMDPTALNKTWPPRSELQELRSQIPDSDCVDWLPSRFAEEGDA